MEKDKDKANEDNKTSKSNIFYDEADKQERGKNKIDKLTESQEDIEAIIQDVDMMQDNEATYQNLRNKKSNSFINNEDEGNRSKGEIGNIEKLCVVSEENNKSQTDRKYIEERGGSGNAYDAGNLDSPNSQSNLKNKEFLLNVKQDGKHLNLVQFIIITRSEFRVERYT